MVAANVLVASLSLTEILLVFEDCILLVFEVCMLNTVFPGKNWVVWQWCDLALYREHVTHLRCNFKRRNRFSARLLAVCRVVRFARIKGICGRIILEW